MNERKLLNFNERRLLNWSEISRLLSGNRSSIREKSVPQKYERKVNQIIKAVREAVTVE